MNKIILDVKSQITQRHICFILCLLFPIGIIFVPGNYEVRVRSSTDVIKENIIRNQQNNEVKIGNVLLDSNKINNE
ncbi:hypothetical protein [Tepidibacter aestuarii]|uniref:hypothetical protein n=1 Tax=Tepidibacter aestuarii TaxID=2925782 RepID=UPI0020BE9BFB|nr:hypothetical protein [Tepidibacter aestuarii]CAH2213195.1 protein of unknown function [Tepidibacter aestuarii]